MSTVRSALLAWVLALVAGCAGAAPQPLPCDPPDVLPTQSASVADDAFIDQYAVTQRFRLGQPTSITVAPDGQSVLFLRSGPRSLVRDLYSYDVRTRQERVVVTAEQILNGGTEQLSDQERARRERLRLTASGITSFEVSTDGARILVPLSGRLFIVDRQDGRVRELQTGDGYADDPHLSPDGSKIAFVRGGDLYAVGVSSGAALRLTTTASATIENGLPEFIAQEEMDRYRGFWWSPDSTQVAYQETDTSEVETLHILDPMFPERPPRLAPYPRTGHRNARVRVGIVPARGGNTRWLNWDSRALPYLVSVRWSSVGPLTLVVQNRAQTEEHILEVDPRTGEPRTIHVERDSAWVNIDQGVPQWLADGREFLWATEREGAPQLELRGRDGALLRAVTAPELGYHSTLHVDAERREVWVLASADPTELHVYRVALDPGGEPQRLTAEAGVHDAVVGHGDVWIRHSMPLGGGNGWTVSRGGEVLGELRSRAEEPPFVPRLGLVEIGDRRLHAAVIRPRNFDEELRYPVLVSVYGGPGHATVRATPLAYLVEQWYADHGYIVVSIDGRGTPGRGREWERAIHGNFIELPLADQVAGLQELGRRFPEMDLSRTGIFGWSFGGYFSAMAVMQRPDVFHAGVAGAPVADWLDYDTHYTERYLGQPGDHQSGYEASSVLTYVSRLRRPLLIIHGTVDDNVYFTHAVKMSDALLRAGRPHDFLPLSGFTHMVAEPDVTRSLHQAILGYFQQHLARSQD